MTAAPFTAVVQPAALAAACKLTSAAAPKASTMPILSGVRLVPGDDGVTLAATDLETSVRALVADVPATGEPVLVSHRLLTQVAQVAGTRPLHLTVDGRALSATSGRSQWRMPLMHEPDFPTLPELPDVLGKVDAAELAAAVRVVSLAASREDALPFLTGVHLTFESTDLLLRATDRYRIHTARVPWTPVDPDALPGPLLVPARTVRTVLGFGAGAAELAADHNLFAAATGGARFTTRLLVASQFPPVERLMPARADATTVVTVDSAALADALAAAAVGADGTGPIRVTFTPDVGIGIEARDEHGNVAGTGDLDAAVAGERLVAGFNVHFLRECLGTFGDEPCELQFKDASRPAAFARPGEEPTALVMPVRLPEAA